MSARGFVFFVIIHAIFILFFLLIGESEATSEVEEYDDKNIVMAAVREDGFSIYYASDRLKDDYDVVLAAVKENGVVLQHASDRLRNDKEIVNAALENGSQSTLQHASDRLKDDKDVAMAAVKKYGSSLRFVSDRIKDDYDVVLAAVMENGMVIQHASDRLRDDEDVVSAAMKNYGIALMHANDRLRRKLLPQVEDFVPWLFLTCLFNVYWSMSGSVTYIYNIGTAILFIFSCCAIFRTTSSLRQKKRLETRIRNLQNQVKESRELVRDQEESIGQMGKALEMVEKQKLKLELERKKYFRAFEGERNVDLPDDVKILEKMAKKNEKTFEFIRKRYEKVKDTLKKKEMDVYMKDKLRSRIREKEEELRMCGICSDMEIDTFLDPCGHMFCSLCASKVSTCPICRRRIRERKKAFL